ncbi:hypothetical protein BKA81DRAFT_406092 [Phyllosticta paracitricarpa]|uniref:Uncharacterized protein n=1 Tax=Phyllosticta paracitricarpa TaxID=2016321 RepID=A0ABR1MVQ2_9PEZI
MADKRPAPPPAQPSSMRLPDFNPQQSAADKETDSGAPVVVDLTGDDDLSIPPVKIINDDSDAASDWNILKMVVVKMGVGLICCFTMLMSLPVMMQLQRHVESACRLWSRLRKMYGADYDDDTVLVHQSSKIVQDALKGRREALQQIAEQAIGLMDDIHSGGGGGGGGGGGAVGDCGCEDDDSALLVPPPPSPTPSSTTTTLPATTRRYPSRAAKPRKFLDDDPAYTAAKWKP